jgi:hypothetical protein
LERVEVTGLPEGESGVDGLGQFGKVHGGGVWVYVAEGGVQLLWDVFTV